jgi:hypothetical protein
MAVGAFDDDAAADKAEKQGDYQTGDVGGAPPQGGSQSPSGPRIYPQTDTTPVPFDYARFPGGTADGYERFQSQYPNDYYYRTMDNARGYPAMLRAQARDPRATPEQKNAYDNFLTQLRGYTGSKLGTMGSVDTAWDGLLDDAQRGDVAALQLLGYGTSPDNDGGRGSGGGGGRYGTTSSVTHANEADVRALANTVAENMIGRNLSDKEFNKIYGRFRSGEAASPTVTTSSPGGSVTQQGATAQERQDILEEIIMENPEFSTYQGGEGMLDKMTDINKQVRSENAGL